MGAVNCDNDSLQGICEKQGVTIYPTIKWYSKGKDMGKYKSKLTASDIVSWALKLLPSNLVGRIVSEAQLNDILRGCSGSGKGTASWSTCVLLFTDKQETPPLLKTLALKVRNAH